jgi:quinol monooxygenase YgiN
MKNLGLLATVKAKKGKEEDVKNFLSNAVEHAKKENETLTWYSFQIDDSTFGIFDTFENEQGRKAHLNGEIAKALMANASELLVEDPNIRKIEILSSK